MHHGCQLRYRGCQRQVLVTLGVHLVSSYLLLRRALSLIAQLVIIFVVSNSENVEHHSVPDRYPIWRPFPRLSHVQPVLKSPSIHYDLVGVIRNHSTRYFRIVDPHTSTRLRRG